MIKKYKEFIRENIEVEQTDSPESASDKNEFNNSEKDVKEFLAKKVTLDNIYTTYTDEKDLVTKLFAQKFIPVNTGDKKKIQFTNPLIGIYAQSAEKKRELKSLQDNLTTQTDTLSQRKNAISQNPDNKESMTNDIEYTQNKISDINTQILKMKSEISSLERSTSDKLNQMKNGLIDNKKRIDSFTNSK